MWTDASGTTGQGAFFTDPGASHSLVSWQHAFSKPLSRHHCQKDINFKEMHIVLLAIQRWLLYFGLYELVIFTDNTTVYHGLRRHSVQGPAMDPFRKITYLAALHNIDIHAQWIPTHENTLADLLSRRDFTKLANQLPLLTQEPNTRQSHATLTSASLALQPATSSGASVQIPDKHTKQPAIAM